MIIFKINIKILMQIVVLNTRFRVQIKIKFNPYLKLLELTKTTQ